MENPYAPSDAGLQSTGGMPRSIITALVAMVAIMSLDALLGILELVNLGSVEIGVVVRLALTGLVLIGILNRHRLAWQWGRILALLGAIIGTIVIPAGVMEVLEEPDATHRGIMMSFVGLLVVQVVATWTVFFAFGRPSARLWFRLICPGCGVASRKANDFLFNQAKCGNCHNVW